VCYCVTNDDQLNLGLALAALETNPSLRIVLRQFNVRLGRLVSTELRDRTALSMSARSAPTFAAAALTPGVAFAHAVGDRLLVVREVGGGDLSRRAEYSVFFDPRKRSVIAASSGAQVVVPSPSASFPPETRYLLATSDLDLPALPAAPPPARVRGPLAERRQDRLLLGTLAFLGVVVALGALYFQSRLGLGQLDAVYFVVTIITSVGFGDFSLRDADDLSKVVGIALMVSGVMMSAVLFGLVTNYLVARHRAYVHGQVRVPLRDHVVVCGLGVVGFRVAQTLKRLGRAVVAIEADEQGRFVAEARSQGIHVVIGDALQEKTLAYANVAQASSFVVCTNPDFLNLEIALHVRSSRPGLPIVLRLFDPDLSRRVARIFGFRKTFSSASLSATAFASIATGSTLVERLEFHGSKVEIHEVRISNRVQLSEAPAPSGARPIAVASAQGDLRFDLRPDDRLETGEVLLAARLVDGGKREPAAGSRPT
jgi:Trk K+ transport system NAD-binding subunit